MEIGRLVPRRPKSRDELGVDVDAGSRRQSAGQVRHGVEPVGEPLLGGIICEGGFRLGDQRLDSCAPKARCLRDGAARLGQRDCRACIAVDAGMKAASG